MRVACPAAFCGEPRPDREGEREDRKIHVYRMAIAGTTVALTTSGTKRGETNSAHDVLCQFAQCLKHP